MRTLSKEELQEILEKHKKWLTGKDGGERANFRGVDLRGVNFREADLRGADFRNADFSGANFRVANLRGAFFKKVNFRGAVFIGADLRGADFRNADFSGANFRVANLRGAFFKKVNFRGADLRNADLRGAVFIGAFFKKVNFIRADLRGVDFRGVDFRNAFIYFPIACPESGSFTGYKSAGGYIVKLKILEDAKRSSATTRKCRCDKAEVIAIENSDGTVASVDSVKSNYDSSFVYRIGEVVCVDNFDNDRWNECTAGIHFFITRDEAVRYSMW